MPDVRPTIIPSRVALNADAAHDWPLIRSFAARTMHQELSFFSAYTYTRY
jgi:hypothetical protein